MVMAAQPAHAPTGVFVRDCHLCPTRPILLRIPARRNRRIVGRWRRRQKDSFAEIDELRLAVDEAVILLLDGSDGDARARRDLPPPEVETAADRTALRGDSPASTRCVRR